MTSESAESTHAGKLRPSRFGKDEKNTPHWNRIPVRAFERTLAEALRLYTHMPILVE
jgi:hypothetical protein